MRPKSMLLISLFMAISIYICCQSGCFLCFCSYVSYKTVWLLCVGCKRHAKLYGPCVAAASVMQNCMALAWLLQASYKTVWPLRGCCKHHTKLYGPCVAAASIMQNFFFFARGTPALG
ncbi:hypothetical protein [Tannerella forsythia]|uniref:hypothetical protein n=1 Tax=Tannerella forsythia TaxID=28112 RepID=UPI003F80FA5C